MNVIILVLIKNGKDYKKEGVALKTSEQSLLIFFIVLARSPLL